MSTVQDKSLRLTQFDSLADIEADDVLYQKIQAETSSEDNYSFIIRPPSHNSLLDNEVWIEYTLQPTGDQWTTQFAGAANLVIPRGDLGSQEPFINFRDGMIMNKAIANISIKLNGQNFISRPYVWQSVLEHLYFSREESENLLSLSGGAFDTGIGLFTGRDRAFTAQERQSDDNTMQGAVSNAGGNLYSYIHGTYRNPLIEGPDNKVLIGHAPSGSVWINEGWDKRLDRVRFMLRWDTDNSFANNTVGLADITKYPVNVSTNIKIWEKLPVYPFKTFDNKDLKMSIPNVRELEINVTYLAKSIAKRKILQSGYIDIDDTKTDINFHSVKPIIHLKWYTTKLPIPKSLVMPAYISRVYEEQFERAAWTDADNQTKFVVGEVSTLKTINLEAVPDLLLIYFAKDPTVDANYIDPTQYHLSINSIRISIGGTGGKMIDMSTGEMYSHYLRNVRHNGTGKMNFTEWHKFHCTLAVRPRDVGITWGPGFNYPIQIQVTANLTDYWNIPTVLLDGVDQGSQRLNSNVATKFKQFVVAFYDRVSYTINANGSSKVKMLKIPLAPVQQQERQDMQQPTSSMQSILNI